ncbi:Protein of unknown function [Paraoerskovia marina]|uniref:DUF4235 domain-containing protein n=1 Tax=Paraoerskovia marina TaxID=545619 RepID=A0A1H1P9T4_9CELL|nr:DUF4235 domain-containing protein [Paraoerskovia marina]SDS07765.1 Protein of unknown function [Paraoerskovia marina]
MSKKKQKKNDDQDMATKVATLALTFAAGWIATKVVSTIWKKASGHDAPTDTDDPDISLPEAMAFAAITGGVGVLARRLAAGQATKVSARLTGGNPHAVPDVEP